jgi:hypothetical protein
MDARVDEPIASVAAEYIKTALLRGDNPIVTS